MIWIALVLLLFILQMAFVIFSEYQRPNKTVVWLIVLYIFPIIGFLLYLFLAKEYMCSPAPSQEQNREWNRIKADLMERCRQRIRKNHHGETIGQDDDLHALLSGIPVAPITACNETMVFSEGEGAFEAMLSSIAASEHHIHIEFYIIRDDRLGTRFEQLLIRKAQEGVHVRLLFDGIGSRQLGKTFLKRLRDAGVETGCFFPLLASFMNKRINYRNHRKIVVVDGKTGFFGGLNIGDEYLGEDPKLGYWRDTHFSIKGDAVLWLQFTFLTDWHRVTGQIIADSAYYPIQESQGKELVQVVKSGPDETMLEIIFSLIVTAKKRILIETPYFILEPGVFLALKTAILRGVDVHVIIPGVPDKHLVYTATLSYVQELLRAGVRFYSYQKGFIHAKVIISDDLAFSGSANMDIRSFCNQFEINALFYDGKVVNRLVDDFYRDLGESEEILQSKFEKRNALQKMQVVFARLLSPLF
ncbi:cardiolipin synthase [Paenibacillus sp. 7124]|uniref:Cardiolipin synthase n=1 Tax=Paenibacillus apii TaxID=1850370 RepID=A0A6M1PKI1_9BACL|nr:cardiolipin synthase [Paenibacillus apii]NGM80821.1 cardiolipin synthase [Paenibacillus apii]